MNFSFLPPASLPFVWAIRNATAAGNPRNDRWAAIEQLESRIAPAGLAASTHFAQSIPIGGADGGVSLAESLADLPPPPDLTAIPTAPDIFTSEHPGFLIDSQISEFETPGFKGTIESLVVRRTATTDELNLPVGGLDFYFQVSITSGHPLTAISSVTLGLFDPFLFAAGVDGRSGVIVSTDPLNGRNGDGQSPVLMSYDAGTLRFDFTSETLDHALTLDEPNSKWLVLRTDARSYADDGNAGIFGEIPDIGDLSTNVAIFAPTATEPQPRALVVTGASSGSLVQVFDPATGALQESFNAFGSRNKYGVRVATGDVNGDGVEDIIVGSGRNNVGGAQVRVFDGANPAHPPLPGLLGNFKPFGAGFVGAVNVASGDVNGDGRADIIVSPASGSSGQVRVFDGVDGSLIKKFTALSKVNGGVRVAAGDLDGDGRDEVIVGAGIGSAVRVFNGLTGILIPELSFQAFEKSYTRGVNVAAGDVNGDGIDEIFVSTAEGTDRIGIFDHTLVKLAEIRTGAPHGVRIAVADVNGDGFADILAGQSTGGTTAVSVFNGLSRSKLLDLSGYVIGGKIGVFVG